MYIELEIRHGGSLVIFDISYTSTFFRIDWTTLEESGAPLSTITFPQKVET
jgi:hypothetical protein